MCNDNNNTCSLKLLLCLENIFINSLKKKNEMEKFKQNLGLELLDEEINRIKKKTSFIVEKVKLITAMSIILYR